MRTKKTRLVRYLLYLRGKSGNKQTKEYSHGRVHAAYQQGKMPALPDGLRFVHPLLRTTLQEGCTG